MQTVEIFIGTSLRGPAKGPGKTMYLMRTKKKNGEYHESKQIAEYDNATESRLVLYAIRDAIGRINFACRVVIHTECIYVAAAIERHWPQAWQENAWKTRKRKEVKDAVLWSMIMQDIEASGHELEAVPGEHEWSKWMKWKLQLTKANKDTFCGMDEE